jgi:hypothetical protein
MADATSNNAQTAAGTTQATATAALADHVSAPTVTAGAGVILKPGNAGEIRSVTNADQSNWLLVYPPVGAAFNGITANLPLTLPSAKAALFIFTSPTTIMAIFS